MSTQDEKVQKLFEKVQAKKADIAKAERPNWETNCAFRADPDSSKSVNIQIVSKVKDLVAIMSFLLREESFHKKACDELGVDVKFEWNGFTIDQWKADLKSRAHKIDISKQKKELEALETRLNALVSPEMKAQMELDEITKILGD